MTRSDSPSDTSAPSSTTGSDAPAKTSVPPCWALPPPPAADPSSLSPPPPHPAAATANAATSASAAALNLMRLLPLDLPLDGDASLNPAAGSPPPEDGPVIYDLHQLPALVGERVEDARPALRIPVEVDGEIVGAVGGRSHLEARGRTGHRQRHRGADVVALEQRVVGQRQQEVLGPDGVVPQRERLAQRALEDLLRLG